MKIFVSILIILSIFFLIEFANCQDPAESWLAYCVSNQTNKLVTYVNATTIVPSNPKVPGASPAFWVLI